ncbi:MAG: fatty acid desaturase [Flavobacteriales bacterium]
MSTTVEPIKPLRYSHTIGKDFSKILNKRVRAYFKENNITKYANSSMVVKTIFMILLYLVPFALIMFGAITSTWGIFAMFLVMGVGMAGIGLSIMHDANHGAYSKNDNVNKWLGRVINLVGGYALNWKIQHNVLHHTYTNVHEYDEDISTIGLLRFTPDDPRKPVHRFQHLYAWFFYGLMTVMWMTTKDFQQLKRYKKKDLLKTFNTTYKKNITILIISKIIYYSIFIVLPMIFLPIPWYLVLVFVLAMHYVAGFILAIVFQPAHVIPETEFVKATDDFTIENNFFIHQMETTCNFAPDNKILSWFVGGLNYQVEHHLFPTICHVHYKKLSKIVKATAEEFGVPYNSHKTFSKAIMYHTQMLKDLGRA